MRWLKKILGKCMMYELSVEQTARFLEKGVRPISVHINTQTSLYGSALRGCILLVPFQGRKNMTTHLLGKSR